jgi:hypothetical protein
MTVRDATPHPPAAEDQDDKHRLTALEGLAALSLDALSSVAYGPEAIVIVLAAAGTAGLAYTLPVTIAIVVLLAVLVISYRQVIEAFPGGGGAYAVAKRHLGQKASLVPRSPSITSSTPRSACPPESRRSRPPSPTCTAPGSGSASACSR